MPNFLVPDIDTSGIRSADIQARNTNYMNQLTRSMDLGNVLKEREVERLPVTEAREDEMYERKKIADNLLLTKGKLAIAIDAFGGIDQKSYGEFLEFVTEDIGLPGGVFAPESEVKGWTDEKYKEYKQSKTVDATKFFETTADQWAEILKAVAAQGRTATTAEATKEAAKTRAWGTVEAAKIKAKGDKDKEGWKFTPLKDEKFFIDNISSIFEGSLSDPFSGKWSFANNEDARHAQQLSEEAISEYKKAEGGLTGIEAVNKILKKHGYRTITAEESKILVFKNDVRQEFKKAFPDKNIDDIYQDENGNWFVKSGKQLYPVNE